MLSLRITLIIVLISSLANSAANAETVGGIISIDTVWSNTAEPYTFNSSVQVKNGVTLTILPGVRIENGVISVYGNLVSAGISTNPVVFTNVQIIPSGIVSDPSKKFSIDIANTVILGGSLYPPGAAYGTLSLQSSYLKDVPYMWIWYPTSDVVIYRNYFENFGGIRVGSSNVNVLIENNYFKNPSSVTVENWASYGTALTTVRNNSFSNASVNIISLGSDVSAKMDARENYWGTAEEAVIQGMIFDANDNLSIANSIPYLPFLLDHHPDTPQTSPVIVDINASPNANAGPDQIVLDEINLDGSQSFDPDNDPLTYQWQIQNIANPLINITVIGEVAAVSSLQKGFYNVTLRVSDSKSVATDTMLFAAAGIKGDLDGDGDVDGDDLSIMANNFGK